MISSITTETRPYIIERDRASLTDEQTVFHVRSKTVREGSQTAANYAKAQVQKRRGTTTEFDADKLNDAEAAEFIRAVRRVENFRVQAKAPDRAFDHFSAQRITDPSGYVDGTEGSIIVKDTSKEEDVKYIYACMDVADTEEVLEASVKQSKLEESVKN